MLLRRREMRSRVTLETATKSSSSVCSSKPAMKINQKGKVSMSSMKSSSKDARDTLDAIHKKALNEIIEKILDRTD